VTGVIIATEVEDIGTIGALIMKKTEIMPRTETEIRKKMPENRDRE
jgi:hypothetical protein